MNDLDLMAKFRADVPPADPAVLRRARNRLADAPSSRQRPSPWLWRLVPAVGLAAAVAVAAVLVHQPDQAARPEQAGGPAPAASASAPTGTGSVPTPTDAAGVLRLAAAEVRQEPVLRARPDQFVFVESLASWANADAGADGKSVTWHPAIERNRKVWLSVDGSRDGRIKDSVTRQPLGDDDRSGPLPDTEPAYRDDLPTDPKAMRAYLYRGVGEDRDDDAYEKVGDLILETYLPPDSMAALFEAAGTIPGVTLVKGQVDLAGRSGIAVSRLRKDYFREDLIFDAESHRYLGQRMVAVKASAGLEVGTVLEYTAQLRIAIVDRLGQLP
ncbi:CU044_5270 family protein [Micromonosporaceae bacterium Da 78-11]